MLGKIKIKKWQNNSFDVISQLLKYAETLSHDVKEYHHRKGFNNLIKEYLQQKIKG